MNTRRLLLATTVAAAIVALVRAHFPDLGYAAVIQRVAGSVDTSSHWQSLALTGGRVDAGRALTDGVPTFSAQPASLNAASGQSFTLSCTAAFSGGSVTCQWRRNGTPINGANNGWQMQGTGDFDGDGHDDLIFSSMYSGRRSIWLMQGTNVSSTAALSGASLNWLIRNR